MNHQTYRQAGRHTHMRFRDYILLHAISGNGSSHVVSTYLLIVFSFFIFCHSQFPFCKRSGINYTVEILTTICIYYFSFSLRPSLWFGLHYSQYCALLQPPVFPLLLCVYFAVSPPLSLLVSPHPSFLLFASHLTFLPPLFVSTPFSLSLLSACPSTLCPSLFFPVLPPLSPCVFGPLSLPLASVFYPPFLPLSFVSLLSAPLLFASCLFSPFLFCVSPFRSHLCHPTHKETSSHAKIR